MTAEATKDKTAKAVDPEEKKQSAEAEKPHHDDLDEALANTFPASDPPAAPQETGPIPRPSGKSGS